MSNKLTEKPASTAQPTDFFVNVAGAVMRLTWAGFKALLDALYSAVGHAHAIADTTGLQAALDGKAPVALAAATLTYAESMVPNCNAGLRRKITLTGPATLNAPINGTDGMAWNGRFLASGANRPLTLAAEIRVPSGFSGMSNPVTIDTGATWMVQLEYDSALAAWVLTGWTGGYS
jgi:hypothetical protein